MDKHKEYLKYLIKIFSVSVLIILQACATAPSPGNPWQTPNRSISFSSEEEAAEVVAFMQPCIEYARETFPEAVRRFKAGLPPNTSFIVVARNDQKRHFYMKVNAVDESQIQGRIDSSERVKQRPYDAGDKLSLDLTDIVDWLIIYPDRPEEGNLTGKYLLMREDGLMSGPCNPQHSEFQHFRLFLESYSFVPPSEAAWRMRGRDANFDASLATVATGGMNEVNTIYTVRYKTPIFKTDQELINKITETEKKNIGDPDRVALLDHKVTAYKEKETRCVLSHQVIEDKNALLDKSGKRGLMNREILSLVCVHPKKQDTVVALSYSHRYHPGKKDTMFPNKANNVFQSLAFSE